MTKLPKINEKSALLLAPAGGAGRERKRACASALLAEISGENPKMGVLSELFRALISPTSG